MKLIKRLLIGMVVVNALFVAAALIFKRTLPAFGDEESETFALVASMDGVQFASTVSGLKHGAVTAFLGGAEVDLTQATIADRAVLELRAVLGGIDVTVPPEWRVEVDRTAVAGEIVNGTDPDAVAEDAPVLVVPAAAYFGGIQISAG